MPPPAPPEDEGEQQPVPAAVLTVDMTSDKRSLYNGCCLLELTAVRNCHPVAASLSNPGRWTCFLNSILQCLVHTVPLVSKFLNDPHLHICHSGSQDFCCYCLLHKHTLEVISLPGSVLYPTTFVEHLNFIMKDIEVGRHQDAHEFLRCFLDILDASAPPSSSSQESVSVVQEIFGGQLKSQLNCPECGHYSDKLEAFHDLNLEVNQMKSVIDLLDSYTNIEVLPNYYCEGCKALVHMQKRLLVEKLPEVLVLHLKRFESSGNGISKIEDMVDYQLEIDLNRLMSSPNNKPDNYDLYGVVEHLGQYSGGHYVCYIRSSENDWYLFNDDKVTRLTGDEAVKHQAYLLFYVKRGAYPWFSTLLERNRMLLGQLEDVAEEGSSSHLERDKKPDLYGKLSMPQADSESTKNGTEEPEGTAAEEIPNENIICERFLGHVDSMQTVPNFLISNLEKNVEELTRQCLLKSKEIERLTTLLQHKDMNEQALNDIIKNHDNDKKFWASATSDLEIKLKGLEQNLSSEEIYDDIDSFLSQFPPTEWYPLYSHTNVLISTEDGRSFVLGFTTFVVVKIEAGLSWGGRFGKEHLEVRKRHGIMHYIINKKPTENAGPVNSLLDLKTMIDIIVTFFTEGTEIANYLESLRDFIHQPPTEVESSEGLKKFIGAVMHQYYFFTPAERSGMLIFLTRVVNSLGDNEKARYYFVMGGIYNKYNVWTVDFRQLCRREAIFTAVYYYTSQINLTESYTASPACCITHCRHFTEHHLESTYGISGNTAVLQKFSDTDIWKQTVPEIIEHFLSAYRHGVLPVSATNAQLTPSPPNGRQIRAARKNAAILSGATPPVNRRQRKLVKRGAGTSLGPTGAAPPGTATGAVPQMAPVVPTAVGLSVILTPITSGGHLTASAASSSATVVHRVRVISAVPAPVATSTSGTNAVPAPTASAASSSATVVHPVTAISAVPAPVATSTSGTHAVPAPTAAVPAPTAAVPAPTATGTSGTIWVQKVGSLDESDHILGYYLGGHIASIFSELYMEFDTDSNMMHSFWSSFCKGHSKCVEPKK